MLGWFVETTLVASGLAVVAAMGSRLRSIGPTARHVLWLVVLVKLMTPPLLCWPWAVALGITRAGSSRFPRHVLAPVDRSGRFACAAVIRSLRGDHDSRTSTGRPGLGPSPTGLRHRCLRRQNG